MFTGIVQGQGQIQDIINKEGLKTFKVKLPFELSSDLIEGASIANNGCCLTITHVEDDCVYFDLMQETLKLTNLGQLKAGDWVNLERAARIGDEIGGHMMSGHIICTATVDDVVISPNNRTVWFDVPEFVQKYLFSKGFVGIDGISLTIGEVKGNRFNVHLIPETIARTNLGTRQKGEAVNIEVDPQTQAVVDTVERVLQARQE